MYVKNNRFGQKITKLFAHVKDFLYLCGDFNTNNMEKLIGRIAEMNELQTALDSERSEFVMMYGRRRVGKTFLVRRFFKDKYTFHFVGAHKQPINVQLTHFQEALQEFSGDTIPKLTNWHEAFLQLERYLEKSKDKRKVLFFDEMPWMDTQKSDFVSELEYFWASWAQNRDDIVFIACGSATAWMKEKLEDNQGGLHNRLTHRIYLRPFYLNECKEYLRNKGFDWDDYQIMQLYMILGGVPYYLSLLQPHMSLIANIDALLFRYGAALKDEFGELFNALFKRADRYIRIVQLLATKREGFTKTEITEKTGYSGGGLTKMLENLERCDFVLAYAQYGNKTKQTLYRLCDFYTLFYFHYIKDNRTRDDEYWQHHFQDRGVESWEGFSFEELCFRHLPHIKHALGISGMATEASSWRYAPKEGKGAQVDLVISRVDKMTHLCEMKFCETPYTITKKYAETVSDRKQLFMDVNDVSRGVIITFVTPKGLKQGVNNSLVHSSITAEDLFATLGKV